MELEDPFREDAFEKGAPAAIIHDNFCNLLANYCFVGDRWEYTYPREEPIIPK